MPCSASPLKSPWTARATIFGDAQDQRVRVVASSGGTYYGQRMTAGDIYTIAGTGEAGFSPDGTPATEALMDFPDERVDHRRVTHDNRRPPTRRAVDPDDQNLHNRRPGTSQRPPARVNELQAPRLYFMPYRRIIHHL